MTPTPAHKAPAERHRKATKCLPVGVGLTCGGCDAVWNGTTRAHCAACHHTFNSVTPFDRHRRGGRCLDPADLGFVRDNDGIWRDGHDFDPAEAFQGGHQ